MPECYLGTPHNNNNNNNGTSNNATAALRVPLPACSNAVTSANTANHDVTGSAVGQHGLNSCGGGGARLEHSRAPLVSVSMTTTTTTTSAVAAVAMTTESGASVVRVNGGGPASSSNSSGTSTSTSTGTGGRNSMGFQITSVTQSADTSNNSDAADESGDEECGVTAAGTCDRSTASSSLPACDAATTTLRTSTQQSAVQPTGATARVVDDVVDASAAVRPACVGCRVPSVAGVMMGASEAAVAASEQPICVPPPSGHLPVIPTTHGFGITLLTSTATAACCCPSISRATDAASGSASLSVVSEKSPMSAAVGTQGACSPASSAACTVAVVEFPCDLAAVRASSGDDSRAGGGGGTAGSGVAGGGDGSDGDSNQAAASQTETSCWQNRFKVVKIETNEPFRRGRWLCMDYLDRPEAATTGAAVAVTSTCTSSTVTPAGGGGGSGGGTSVTSSSHSSLHESESVSRAAAASPPAPSPSSTTCRDDTTLTTPTATTTTSVAAAGSPAASETVPVVTDVVAGVTCPSAVVSGAAVAAVTSTAVSPDSQRQQQAATTAMTFSRRGSACDQLAGETGGLRVDAPVFLTTRTAVAASSDSFSGGLARALSSNNLLWSGGAHHNQDALASGYSGSSTVVGGSGTGVTPIDTSKLEPIDNKIEQAMDLVKSHLLLAVREEVDVLKTSISRLTERIGCLERENDLLRLNVPSDVLQQLDTKQCHQSSSSTTITPAPPSISNNNTAAGVVPMLASSMSVAAGETTPADSHTPSITDISPA